VGRPEGNRQQEDPDVDGSIRVKRNSKVDLRKIGWRCGLDSSGSDQRPVAGLFEHGNKFSGSITLIIFCVAKQVLASQEGLRSWS
jgi:hypothetical protein